MLLQEGERSLPGEFRGRLVVAHRDRGVFFPKVQLRGYFRLLVGMLDDLSAVIAEGRRQAVELRGREKGEAAAEAVADDSGRAALFGVVDRRLNVLHHRSPIGTSDELAGIGDFVGRVAAFEIRMLSVEDCGRNRRIALSGETVADRANVMVDAEYFLNDDDPALRGSARFGTISAQLEIVRGDKRKMLTQDYVLLRLQ